MAEFPLREEEGHVLVTFCVNRVIGASTQVCTVKESEGGSHKDISSAES